MTNYVGTDGDDNLHGGGGQDLFDLTQGGNDRAAGGAGNDEFEMGATLTALDRINGGAGYNVVDLEGDYSSKLVLGADTLVNINALFLRGAFSYNLVANDAMVAAGVTLTVYGQE